MIYKSYIVLIVCVFLLFSCKEKHDEYHNIMDKIQAKSVSINKDTVPDLNDFEHLVKIEDAHPEFYINSRVDKITSYACTECHTKDLSQMQSHNAVKKAHWDIKLSHANEDVMNCATCHNTSNLDELKNNTAKTISFNQSYQLCAQCHSKQVDDWKGGAHGKNLSGWQSKRVSKLCVECHNPHDPSFKSKWPERYNTHMAAERE